jgi:acyl-CoA hydrolase
MTNFKRSQESAVSITELMLPSHSNFNGKVHGGYILNHMDQIAFACASKHSQSYCVTASVNRVDFLHPIEVGELVTIKASTISRAKPPWWLGYGSNLKILPPV